MSKRKKTNNPKTAKVADMHLSKRSIGTFAPWFILLFTFLLYANTIGHEYTQDDAIVIYDNMFTEQGIAGIPGHLSNDTFYGFFKTEGKAKLVSGGRYRPLTPIMFSIENALFGKGPMGKHIINILCYALLCLLIYKTLLLMLQSRFENQETWYLFALTSTLFFAAHPVHTEAVANIKGRDEIVSMMGAVGALFLSLKYIDNPGKKWLPAIAIVVFLGLLAKETTITYLAIIPLAAYFFRNTSTKKAVLPFVAALIGALVFIAIRTSVLGLDFGGTPKELMNNPFLKIVGNSYVPFTVGEKMATILFTLGKYILLLIFPHPLTHDYYPRHIGIMTFADWRVLLSLVAYIGMIAYAFLTFKKRSIYSFAILYFIITLSIVSNIVFPIGTNMSERFLFMPSLGFCLVLAYFLLHNSKKANSLLFLGVTALFLVGYSMKTYTRNGVWKDDFTLFTTDVHTSSNSAKVLNAAGGALVTASSLPTNAGQKETMLNQAIPYLQKALTIHPNYKNAALLLGNAYYYLGDFENAIQSYERALRIAPEYQEAIKNLAITYRDGGRNAGEKERNLEKAKKYLQRSIQLVDSDPDAYRLLGVTHGMAGEHDMAIKYFKKVTDILPNNASAYVNLGKAYQYKGNEAAALEAFQKAKEIDPNALRNN